MAHFVYTMQDLRKVYPPNREVLKGIYLSFYHGAKIGFLGNNGAGKSTLMKIMAGVEKEFTGEAKPGEGVSVGWFPQEPQLDVSKDVKGNIDLGVKKTKDILARFEEVNNKFAEPMSDEAMEKLLAEQARLQDAIDASNAWELDSQIEYAMEALRCPPGDADVSKLSGGERRRVALCKLLLEKPDILLLDEPTNHLDAESVQWLELHLQQYKGTVVAITHDRYFLDNVAGWILELDRGAGIPWEGNYSSWLQQKAKRLALEQKQEVSRQKALERELEWAKSSPRARQAKSKARLQRFEEMANEKAAQKDNPTEIVVATPPRLGQEVVLAEGLSKSYGDKLLFENLSFRLPPGGIVGVIGPNGAGKTTLFRMIMGEEKADKGTLTLGKTVKISYVDQNREALKGDNNAWQEITGGEEIIDLGNGRTVNSRAYCGWFNFKGSDQQKLVKDLSGGERNRLHLAKLLKTGGNLLLLDEPTNDLDVDTLRALEDALLDFPGCAVVISHDRWFLDRIATHILAFEGDSQVVWFEGNYQDYEADRKRRLGAAADKPTRIRYRSLER